MVKLQFFQCDLLSGLIVGPNYTVIADRIISNSILGALLGSLLRLLGHSSTIYVRIADRLHMADVRSVAESRGHVLTRIPFLNEQSIFY